MGDQDEGKGKRSREKTARPGETDPTYRFSVTTRLQHGLLAVSLATLILTGFPIKFASRAWALTVVRFFGTFEGLLAVHLAAATVLAIVAVWYLVAVSVAIARRRLDFAIVPRLKDFRDFGQHWAYLFGLRAAAPRFGKFTWWEKFEFWAVVWGTLLMGLSGLTLAFPEYAAMYVPRWVVGLLRVAHSNEALLSFLAILIGHFFAVHLSPHVFPSSTVWLNGRISLSQLHEDHAMLYEALGGDVAKAPQGMRPSRWEHSRALIAVDFVLFLGLVVAVWATLLPWFFK